MKEVAAEEKREILKNVFQNFNCKFPKIYDQIHPPLFTQGITQPTATKIVAGKEENSVRQKILTSKFKKVWIKLKKFWKKFRRVRKFLIMILK